MDDQGEGPPFEAALEALERIVEGLERGDLDLSASLASYERGVGLLARCQALLDGVDRSVSLLTGVEADGTPILAPFDAAATAPAPPPSAVAPKPRRTRAARPAPAADSDVDLDADEADLPF